MIFNFAHLHLICSWLLEETAVFQVFFDDDVSYSVKHKLNVFCVCGAGHVRVDFFYISAQVQVQELDFDVVASILISVGPWAGQQGDIKDKWMAAKQQQWNEEVLFFHFDIHKQSEELNLLLASLFFT